MEDQVRVNGLLSPSQTRAARAWLNWSKQDLAKKSNVSAKSIARYEKGRSLPYEATLSKLRTAFESAGIRFEFERGQPKGIRVL
ncbi:helix-turn-helix domain-containing protein [Bradyrhizobium yuanmingense]|uniref:helix-turn-helix domain-containing protein n=1 Tax=Bradyrhizobium yuanmingense TaxID=108015 RepID=UPI0023B98F3D|nr:helix-turn-helix transcriptional regulator [Bradyrhizobium yuanmingense]MDF0498263.1 helix-turn-helix transcriptional regulator [Bradyrhizobium yuanmingense]